MRALGTSCVIAITVVGMLLAASGCVSSAYTPRAPGKVATVMQNGQLGYSRDGVFYPRGAFGDGLVRAVAGDPEAEKVARRHARRTRNGFWMGLGGLLCSEIAIIYLASDYAVNAEYDDDYRSSRTATAIAIGCGVLGIYGYAELIGTMGEQYDAINIFNDNSELRRAPVAPVAPWPPPPRVAPPYRPQ